MFVSVVSLLHRNSEFRCYGWTETDRNKRAELGILLPNFALDMSVLKHPALPLDVCSTDPRRLCSATACVVCSRNCPEAACAASGESRPVCFTAASAASKCTCISVSVLQQSVLCQEASGLQQLVLHLDVSVYLSLCWICTCLSTRTFVLHRHLSDRKSLWLCWIWTCLSTSAFVL